MAGERCMPVPDGGGGRGYWSSLENCRKIVLHLTRKIEKIINIQEIDNG